MLNRSQEKEERNKEKDMNRVLKEFFTGEENNCGLSEWPEMEDLKNFDKSAIYQDEVGERLLREN